LRKMMMDEMWELDEDWRREIYLLPDRLLFKHLMGCVIPGLD